MNTDHIKEFLTVVHYNSISKAASFLFTTPSSISKHILALEKELDVILFKPDTHGSILTSEGMLFYESIKPVMQSFEESISALKSKQASTLKIKIHSIQAYQKLYNYIANYKKTYPQIKVEISNFENQPLTNALDNCIADLAIGFMNPNIDETKYISIEIDRINLILATMNHSCSENPDIQSLYDKPLLLPSISHVPNVKDILETIYSKDELHKIKTITVTSFNDLLTQLSFTDCFALLPANYEHLFGNNLCIIKNKKLPTIPLYATYLKTNKKSLVIRFIDYLIGQKAN